MTAPNPPWTVGELVQWRMFFRGERDTMPEGRSLRAARAKFNIPATYKLRSTEMHVMSVAAARFLPQIPYTGIGHHLKFIEDVERCALNPESRWRKEWPADQFLAAVRSARRALYDVSNPNTQRIDNAATQA